MNSTTRIQKQRTPSIVNQLEPVCLIHIGTETRELCPSSFDFLLQETLDSVFSTLGGACKQALYSCLEKDYGLVRDSIPCNIETFAHALEDIFGRASLLLETKIIQMLPRKVDGFKFYPVQSQLSFAKYLESLRHSFE